MSFISFFFAFQFFTINENKVGFEDVDLNKNITSLGNLKPEISSVSNASVYFDFVKEITIDSTKVIGSGDHSNFPVLISLFDSDLRTFTQSDGGDIAFSDGSIWLDHEIEFFDQIGNGTHAQLIAWVKIPSLSVSTDTIIYMYFGNPTIENQENPSNVWDANYKAIWHLEEEPTGSTFDVYDSTINNNDGTASNTATSNSLISAQIGNGLELDGTFHIIANHSNSLDITGNQITLEAWIKIANVPAPSDAAIIQKAGATNVERYMLGIDGQRTPSRVNSRVTTNTGAYRYDEGALYADVWTHIAVVYDGTLGSNNNFFSYIDGTLVSSNDASGNILSTTNVLLIGIREDDRLYYGSIDELRISNTARTTGWITTEYNNQKDPENFLSVGTKQNLRVYPNIDDFSEYKVITIDHNMVSGTENLTDFPFLLSMDDEDLHQDVQIDGDDIAFFLGESDLALDHEIEYFNQNFNTTHGRLVAWIRIPSLSPLVDTNIKMYYGNGTMSSLEFPIGVWDPLYEGIWHLGDDIDPGKDSTLNEHNGTGWFSDPVLGQIGDGIDFNGIDNFINMGDLGTGLKTLSFWMKADDLDGITTMTSMESPTNTGEDYAQWANPTYAYSSDLPYAFEATDNHMQDWFDFNLDLPTDAIIEGIQVEIEGFSSGSNTGVGIELSWDGGNTYTNTSKNHTWGGEYYQDFGNSSDKWGRSWSDSDFNNSNFRLRLSKLQSGGGSDPILVDHIQVKIIYSRNEMILDLDGSTYIEVNQSSQDILTTNFPGNPTIYTNGSISSIIDNGWNYVVIIDTQGFSISSLDLGRVGAEYFSGIIDEFRIRISTVNYSSDWILTEFNNQKYSSSFYSIGTSFKYFCDVEILFLNDAGFGLNGVNVTLFNSSDIFTWENQDNSSKLTIDGIVSFQKLKPQNYTINITFGEKYGKEFLLKSLNISITDDLILIFDNLNITTLKLKLIRYDEVDPDPPDYIYSANVSFYSDESLNSEFYIGSEYSDINGDITFIWLNKSSALGNYSFTVEFFGEIRQINITDGKLSNVTITLENYSFYNVSVHLEGTSNIQTYLNVETGTIMTQNLWGDILTVNVSYGWYESDKPTILNNITEATVTYSLLSGVTEIHSDQFNPNGTDGIYTTNINTTALGMQAKEDYSLKIYATKISYIDQTNTTLISLDPIKMELLHENGTDDFSIYWVENVTINVQLNDTYHDSWINDADVRYEERINDYSSGILTRNTVKGDGWWNFTINSLEFPVSGLHIITIQAEKENYDSHSIDISLTISEIPMELTLEFEETNYEISWLENLTVNARLNGTYYDNWISDAKLTYEEKFNDYISGNLTRNTLKGLGWYSFTFNSTMLPGAGSYFFKIDAEKDNYVKKTLDIEINILKINTFINGSIYLLHTLAINVTTSHSFYFNYTDVEYGAIIGAENGGWELQNQEGDFEITTGDIVNTSIPGVYKIQDLDTSLLGVSTYSLIVSISKENYKERQSAIALIVSPIMVDVLSSSNFYSTPKGNNITISITLIDSYYNRPLTGVNINISYYDEENPMIENGTSGQYYWIINTNEFDVLATAETFFATISIDINKNYTIDDVDITIQVLPPLGLFGWPLIYWIIGSVIGGLALGAFILTKTITYARIPLLVKQMDETSKKIRKNKIFSSLKITDSRDEIIEELSKEPYTILGFSLKGKLTGKPKKVLDIKKDLKKV